MSGVRVPVDGWMAPVRRCGAVAGLDWLGRGTPGLFPLLNELGSTGEEGTSMGGIGEDIEESRSRSAEQHQ